MGPERPTVLLIHGLAQTGLAWTPVARRLRRVARVIAMDLRGHGLSDSPLEGYDAETLAADVAAVADATSRASARTVARSEASASRASRSACRAGLSPGSIQVRCWPSAIARTMAQW
jgi:alpha-beta hydrolase superfamily lysophospholipase